MQNSFQHIPHNHPRIPPPPTRTHGTITMNPSAPTFPGLSHDILVDRIFESNVLDVGDLARLRAVNRATRDAVALVRPKDSFPGLPDDVIVKHILGSANLPDPADLARLRAVSRGMREIRDGNEASGGGA